MSKTSAPYPGCITGLPEIDVPMEGVLGFLSQGQGHQVVFFEIEPIGEVPLHSHGEQWGVVVEGTAEALVFRDPRGEVMEASPSLPPAPPMPADALVAGNRDEELDITAETNRITWAGQPVEYGWAVEALMPGGGPTFGTAGSGCGEDGARRSAGSGRMT